MRFSELRPCDLCGEGLGVTFHEVRSTHHVVDVTKARRRIGLEVFFGGSVALAAMFDGDDNEGTRVADNSILLACESCFALRIAGAFSEADCRRRLESRPPSPPLPQSTEVES